MYMTVTEHLTRHLSNSADYQLTDTDRAFITSKGVEEFIYKTLTNKKFRKWSIDQATQDCIRNAVHRNVSTKQTIKLTFPFGGYKLWRLPSSPEVDWAEFFMLSYYLSYLAPVAAAYAPGVMLSFCSDDSA